MAKPEEFSKKQLRRISRYFSESFKQEKVRQLENNLVTVRQISREYEVSTTAVYKWLYKYSKLYKKGYRQIIEPMSDAHKINALKEKIKELEQIIGQKQIQLDFKEKMIELAEQMYDIDIKKKFGSQRSAGSGRTEKNTPGK